MKTLLLCLFLGLSLASQAQTLISAPSDLNLAPEEFATMYGSVKEFNMQMNSLHDERPVLLIGTKVTYVKEICTFLAGNGYGREVATDNGANWISYDVPVTGIVNKGDMDHLTIKAVVDPKTYRTKTVTITGNPDDMIKLFLHYWQSDISLNQLKKGGYIYQDHASDRVAFSWKGANPVITVSKNPNVGLFEFLTAN